LTVFVDFAFSHCTLTLSVVITRPIRAAVHTKMLGKVKGDGDEHS